MSIFLKNTITGVVTTTDLIDPQLGIYLRENPDIVKVGIATTANANYYLFLSESTVDRKESYVSNNLFFNPSTNILGIGNLSISSSALTGITSISLSGPFYDSSNSIGISGQILSSTGSATKWINSSTTNVGSATSVGINLDSTNITRYITFTDRTSGNGYIQVDSDITYNPSTNVINGSNFNFSGIGTIANFKGTNINVSGIATATTFSGSLANTLTLNTSGTGLSGSTTFNNSGAATFTVTSNATSANTGGTIVSRDASGGFSAGVITASTFSGNLANTLTLNTSGTGLSGSTTFNNSGAATFTVTSNATSTNTNSTIVSRDASGNFNAGIITATLSGNQLGGSISATTGTFSNYLRTLEQVRATGWYGTPTGSSYTGLAVEMGVSGGQGYVISYNRDTSAYGSLNLQSASTTISLPASGSTISVTGAISANNNISGTTLTSTVATGTAPLTVSSTTQVSNLNSSYLQGLQLQSSGSAVGANQIVRSDSNGYSFLNYINSNTTNSENPTVSQVIVTNGSDNYYRKSSIASFTSAVQNNAGGTWGINISGSSAQLNGYSSATSGANVVLRSEANGYLGIENWIRVASGTGIYNSAGAYVYEDTSYGWFMRARQNSSSSLRMQLANGSTIGWYYADSIANQGWLTSAGSWNVRASNAGDFAFNSGYGSVTTAYGCRAWVNFDGSGSTGTYQTIRGSGNVSSVYKNSSGNYTVYFTNYMPDANHSPVVGCSQPYFAAINVIDYYYTEMITNEAAVGSRDSTYATFATFR